MRRAAMGSGCAPDPTAPLLPDPPSPLVITVAVFMWHFVASVVFEPGRHAVDQPPGVRLGLDR